MINWLVAATGKTLVRRAGFRPQFGRKFFCTQSQSNLSLAGTGSGKKPEEKLNEQNITMADGSRVDVKFNGTTVSYELPERVGGATYDTQGQYMVMFTCKRCDTKQSKFFTKKAYHQGVVIVRCEGCDSMHLMADNLGWFGDEKSNIETIMKELNEKVVLGNADASLLEKLQKDIDSTRKKLDEEHQAREAQLAKEESEAEKSAESKPSS